MILKTTGAYAGLGALYCGTSILLRNTRDKDDVWNRVIAGAMAGSLVGLRKHSWFLAGGAAASIAAGTIIAQIMGGTFGPRQKEAYFLRRKEKLYAEPEAEEDAAA